MKKISVSIFITLFCLVLPPLSVKADLGTFSISTTTLPNAFAGVSYADSNSSYSRTIQFTYNGSCTPIVKMTGLPPGITFSSSASQDNIYPTSYYYFVVLTGTPTQSGNFNLIFLNLTDGCGASAKQTFGMEVDALPSGKVGAISTMLPDANVGVPYSDKINFEYYFGLSAPTFSFTRLPPGITAGSLIASSSLSPITGNTVYSIPLSGTAKSPGIYNPVLTITNDAGEDSTFTLNLYVVGSSDSNVPSAPIPISQSPVTINAATKSSSKDSVVPNTANQNNSKLNPITENSDATLVGAAPAETFQNQPEIQKPDLKPIIHTSKIKSFFSGIRNFFKSVGRWFKK